MIEMQPLNEAALAREQLRRMSDEKNSLHRVAHVLELVARSSVGLGEVLQDYARQTSTQLQEFLQAADRVAKGLPSRPDDQQALQNAHLILKAAKAVLQMMPAAMLRNKAQTIGEKEKLSHADITEVLDDFLHSPDIACLLAREDSGQALASACDEGLAASGQERLRASAH